MRLSFLLPLLALTGCAASTRPYAPVDDPVYSALGQQPFWLLQIGDDRIVLRFGPSEAAPDGSEAVFPRTLPRTQNGVTIWESQASPTQVIAIEARPGPCTGAAGRRFEDHVRVRLSGRELTGCGGPVLGEPRG